MDNIISYAKDATTFQKKIVFNAGYESAVNYAEPTMQYCPKISLLFSPFGLPFVPIEILASNVGSIISNMSWTKDRNNPGGVLSATIVPNVDTVKDIFRIISKIPGGNIYSQIWNEVGYDLEDLFKPMTLCQLWIDGYHVMTGTVRGCRRSTKVGNEDYVQSYSLTLDELGNIYTKSTLSLDTILLNGMETHVADSLTKAIGLSANIKGTTVQAGFVALLNAFIASTLLEQGMKMSDGFPLAFRLLATHFPIGAMAELCISQFMFINTNLFEMSAQSFWDYLKNFAPSPWMELFTESGGRTIVTEPFAVPAVLFPGFNYIVSRSTPYSNPLLGVVNPAHWSILSTLDLTAIQMLLGGDFIIITDDEISEKDIGFDGSNQATLFRTKYTAGAGTMPTDFGDKPIQSIGPINPLASGGMGTFGMKEMTEVINCVSTFDAGVAVDGVIARIAKTKLSTAGILSKPAMSNLLAVWFRNQSRFREGSVTLRCKPWARAGMYCLYLPPRSGRKTDNQRDIGIYYIDSLSHNYNLSDTSVSATTTLNLIRGVPLPTSAAKAALLLFDFETLPPVSGLFDDEWAISHLLRSAISAI